MVELIHGFISLTIREEEFKQELKQSFLTALKDNYELNDPDYIEFTYPIIKEKGYKFLLDYLIDESIKKHGVTKETIQILASSLVMYLSFSSYKIDFMDIAGGTGIVYAIAYSNY